MLHLIYNIWRQFNIDGFVLILLTACNLSRIAGIKEKFRLEQVFCAASLFYAPVWLIQNGASFWGWSLPFLWFFDLKNYWIYFMAFLIVEGLTAAIFFKGQLLFQLLYIFFYLAFIQLYKILMSPLYLVEGTISKSSYESYDVLSSVGLYLCLFLLTKLFAKFKISSENRYMLGISALVLYFPIAILLFYTAWLNGGDFLKNHAEPLMALIIIPCIPMLYYLFASLERSYEEKRQLDRALTQTSAQVARYRFSIELEERIKKERHELKNNYFYIQTLLDHGKYDELREYLSNVIGKNMENISAISTGNTMIDYLLNKKISQAKKKEIKLYSEIILPPNLAVNDDVFCTIFFNLIDNAIEACEKEKDPYINLSLKVSQNHLCGSISNKVSQENLLKDPSLATSKKDRANHGLGLKIVQTTLEKNGGFYESTVENNCYTARFMLPLKQ